MPRVLAGSGVISSLLRFVISLARRGVLFGIFSTVALAEIDTSLVYQTLRERRRAMGELLAASGRTSDTACVHAYLALADAYAACGRWHDAQAVLRAGLASYESADLLAALHWHRGRVCALVRDMRGAEEEARRCLAAAPFSYPYVYHWLAVSAWHHGNRRDAVTRWLEGLRCARADAVAQYLDDLAPYLLAFSDDDLGAYYDTLLALLEYPALHNLEGLKRIVRELVKIESVYPDRFQPHDTAALLMVLPPQEAPPDMVLAMPRSNGPPRISACLLQTNTLDECLTRALTALRAPRAETGCLTPHRAALEALASTTALITGMCDRIDGVVPRTLVTHLLAQAEIHAMSYSPLSRSQQLARVVAETARLAQVAVSDADITYLTLLYADQMLLNTLLGNKAAADQAWEHVQALAPGIDRAPVPSRVINIPLSLTPDTAQPLFLALHALTNAAAVEQPAGSAAACLVTLNDLLGTFVVQTDAHANIAACVRALLDVCNDAPLQLTIPAGEVVEPITTWDTLLDFLTRDSTCEAVLQDRALRDACLRMATRWALSVPATDNPPHTRLLQRLLEWRHALEHAAYDAPLYAVLQCDARHWPAACAPALVTDAHREPVLMQPTAEAGVWQAPLVFPAGVALVQAAFLTNAAAAQAAPWHVTVRRDDCVGDPPMVRLSAPRLVAVALTLACDLRGVSGVRAVYALGSHPALGSWIPDKAAHLNDAGRNGDVIAHDGIWSYTLVCQPAESELRFLVVADPLEPERSTSARRGGFVRRYRVPETSAPTATYHFTYGFVPP